ncbi:MAG: PEP-CTERM sorting domain-containing protein [Planctomycetota bacterium]|jgi:hypothetical protein
MTKILFSFLLSLFICGTGFATLCYVEFEPATWSYDSGVFDFEQDIAIQSAEGNEDLIGCTVNLPSLTLVDNTVYAEGNLELFDNDSIHLATAYFDTGTCVDGLRTNIIFYDIDTTEPDTTYIINDIELVMYTTGSKANTFEGNMTLTYIPEPATLLLLGFGAVMLRKRRFKS